MLGEQPRTSDEQRDRVASLLIADGFLKDADLTQARTLVDYLRPHRLRAGTVLFRQGSIGHERSMALILEGEVTVESGSIKEDVVVSVLGPGNVVGEMSLIDEGLRSASCTAATDLQLATLTREALNRLIVEHPALAAQLLMALARRIVTHLRETDRKLMAMIRIGKAIQQELDAVHAVNRRLIDRVATLEQAGASVPIASAAKALSKSHLY